MPAAQPETPIGFDNPQLRFITYCNQTYGNGTIVSCSIQGPNDPNMATEIAFGASADIPTQQACLNVAQNTPDVFGGWTPIALPDLAGFIHDVVTDPNAPKFPIALILCLAVTQPSLSYTDRKTFFATASQWVLSAYPTQGQAVLNAITVYATNRWVPLT